MSRLETTLRAARDSGRKILVPFFTGGYPDRSLFVQLLLGAETSGATAAEVGIPFSDPSADGPVIQQASEAALAAGATVHSVLEDVAAARAKGLGIPLLFMTYYNPLLAFGPEAFVKAARDAGADGILVVDLPAEESGEFAPLAREAGLDTVFLVAPTTPDERVPGIVEQCRGFVYCVSVTGVTGDKRPLVETVEKIVRRVRRHTDLPALVGFGVSSPASARSVSQVSDGVVVGSALLRTISEKQGAEAVAASDSFLRALRRALDEIA